MHKDYTVQAKEFAGQIPSAQANEISDLFAQGKSPADVQQLIRVNDKIVSLGVIKTVFAHIKEIENACVAVLNGSSLIYTPKEDEEGNQLWIAPDKPTNKAGMISVVMMLVGIQGEQFMNVYDVANLTELQSQIEHTIENLIKAQDNGNGTWTKFYNAVK